MIGAGAEAVATKPVWGVRAISVKGTPLLVGTKVLGGDARQARSRMNRISARRNGLDLCMDTAPFSQRIP